MESGNEVGGWEEGRGVIKTDFPPRGRLIASRTIARSFGSMIIPRVVCGASLSAWNATKETDRARGNDLCCDHTQLHGESLIERFEAGITRVQPSNATVLFLVCREFFANSRIDSTNGGRSPSHV